MRRWAAGATALAVLALAGVAGAFESRHDRTTASPQASSSRSVSRTCDDRASGVLTAFVQAYDAGQVAVLRRIVAARPAFRWYSAAGPDPRFNAQALKRATLWRYFAARHAAHERLTLQSVHWNGSHRDGGIRFLDFDYTLERSARDFPDRPVSGKGAIACTQPPTLAVWSLADGVYATCQITSSCGVVGSENAG
jgi:hypothetical protein